MGRIAVVLLLGIAMISGVAIWFLQTRAYYVRLDEGDVILQTQAGDPESLAHSAFRAIDSNSSPLRYRGCFSTFLSLDELRQQYVPYERAEPLTGPSWFDCYDAREIGEALAAGNAIALLGTRDIQWGFDRVVAVLPDGRGMIWHQINECGEEVFDGNPLPEGCTPPPGGEPPS